MGPYLAEGTHVTGRGDVLEGIDASGVLCDRTICVFDGEGLAAGDDMFDKRLGGECSRTRASVSGCPSRTKVVPTFEPGSQ